MNNAASLTPEILQARLLSLAHELSLRDNALALLALGSVGVETHRLDAFSDLDFFVMVKDGAKARYISNLDWLAAVHPLVWHFQNTADGHKALMSDGVFCEFAVFEVHELSRIPYAPGRFVWRRDEVNESLAMSRQALPGRHGADWLVGEALANLMIGLQRHARGEKLAAMRAIQVHALNRVLEFLEQRKGELSDASATPVTRDPYNVDRRIEARHAALIQSLPLWAGGYEHTVPAALALLSCLEEHEAVPASVAAHVRRLATASDE